MYAIRSYYVVGAADALRMAGRRNVALTGIDADRAILERIRAGWDAALAAVAERLRQARAAGAGSVAALGSPRLSNEENYLLQKLFRAAVGTNIV